MEIPPYVAACNKIFSPSVALSKDQFGVQIHTIVEEAKTRGCTSKLFSNPEKAEKLATQINDLWGLRCGSDFAGMLEHSFFKKLTKKVDVVDGVRQTRSIDQELICKMAVLLIVPSLRMQGQQALLDQPHGIKVAEFRAKFALLSEREEHMREYVRSVELLGPIHNVYFADALAKAFQDTKRPNVVSFAAYADTLETVAKAIEKYPEMSKDEGDVSIFEAYARILDGLPDVATKSSSEAAIREFMESNDLTVVKDNAKILIQESLARRVVSLRSQPAQ